MVHTSIGGVLLFCERAFKSDLFLKARKDLIMAYMLLLVFKQESCISLTVLYVNTKKPFRPWHWQY